jgi:tetratricopeptide (TPR) repeat protein
MKLKLFLLLFGAVFLLACALVNPTTFTANNPDTAHWDQVIEQDPSNAEAYYQRAQIIYDAATPKGSAAAYAAKLDQALQDVDQAIALRSDVGDYYALRQSILFYRAGVEEYDVDGQYLYEIALANAYKAYELGTTVAYPERLIVVDLICSGQCQQALVDVQHLIDQTPPDDISLGGLLHIRSQAYACLGELDEALQSVDASMFNNLSLGYKQELKIQYLLMLEQYEEALPLLNARIEASDLAGFLHYMRAWVYYNLGEQELVQAELETGKPKTWSRGGWLAYVEAQLALDEGRTEDAIRHLQLAEATLDPTHNPLRWKIQEQLQALGAHPLVLTPSVPHQATPIP